MSLLAPFDNLLNSPVAARLFGFHYAHEMFLPKAKRRFGTYVMPILWGDRFIGRVDPKMDRETGTLRIQAVHAEPGAPSGREVASLVGETIEGLGEFVEANEVVYSSRVPPGWRNSLR
jgi:hypothetical protein